MIAPSIRIVTLALDGLDEVGLAPLLAVLDADERARAGRFAFARSRVQYVAAHALARAELGAVAGAPPTAFRFLPAEHGKPAALLEGRPAALSFNLSHTEGMVGLALSSAPGLMLGFDLEATSRPASCAVASRVFRPEERSWLDSLPTAERGQGFLRLWTLKEAFIKATGRGLAEGLDSVCFDLPPPRLRFAAPRHGPAGAWAFDQRLVGGTHMAAVGLHVPQPPPPAFVWTAETLPALLCRLDAAEPGRGDAGAAAVSARASPPRQG